VSFSAKFTTGLSSKKREGNVARPKKNREANIIHFSFFDLLFGAFGAFVFLMIMQVLSTLNMVDKDIQKVVDETVQENTTLKSELVKYKEIDQSLKNLQQQHEKAQEEQKKANQEKSDLARQKSRLESELDAAVKKAESLAQFKESVQQKGDLAKTLESQNKQLEQNLNDARKKLAAIKTVPLVIKTTSLPTTITEESVAIALAAEGGSPPYIWELDGKLPSGLVFNTATGAIAGVVKSDGKYDFAVKVTDATGLSVKSKNNIPFTVIKKYEEPKSMVSYWFLIIAIVLALYLLNWGFQKYKVNKYVKEMRAKGKILVWADEQQ
jgi:hypothetical protein